MTRRLFSLLSLVLFVGTLCAQTPHDPTKTPNTFRQADNPWYWQNKLPYPGYWQQDVHYQIDAALDLDSGAIRGTKYELTYWNNSPDTLGELYFHLYQNAFQPGSHYHALNLENGVEPEFGPKEAIGLGTTIENLTVNGVAVETTLDNTILRVKLNQPLLPGSSLTVTCQFNTYFDKGEMRRRMKQFTAFGEEHFDGVHWYPVICVYDRKFGWTTEQHLDKEFYADFGTFDVALTLPSHYLVEATGILQNKDVLPDSIWKKLDLNNFKEKDPNEAPSEILPKNGGTRTWVFHAENVHNFAFTADPSYRFERLNWRGIEVVSAVQEPHAKAWLQSADYALKVIQIYDRDFGTYIWPKNVVADAQDGMEYPMLTLNGGSYPGHTGLLSHEIGHMWYYGMVGTNEQYRAFLDEGFTQYLTVWSLERIRGKGYQTSIKIGSYERRDSVRYRDLRWYIPYLHNVWDGLDMPLETHSSDFRGKLRHSGGYGLVYYKTAAMLEHLRYVLGDSLFLGAMQHYTHSFTGAHPYPEDFRRSVAEYTKQDLNWFFDQWLITTKEMDYGISGLKRNKKKGTYTVTLKREGSMQSPVHLRARTLEGDTLDFWIPNGWYEKPTDATVLPKWYGFGPNLHPEYTTELPIEGRVIALEVDPEQQTADFNRRNNFWPTNHVKNRFDDRLIAYDNYDSYVDYYRPDLWYNAYDGLQVGFTMSGDYFGEDEFYSWSTWWNSGWLQGAVEDPNQKDYRRISVLLTGRTSLRKLSPGLYMDNRLEYNTGLFRTNLIFEKTFQLPDGYSPEPNRTVLRFGPEFMIRQKPSDLGYLIYPDYWSTGKWNNTFRIDLTRYYTFDEAGRGELRLETRFAGPLSDFNYTTFDLESKRSTQIWKFDWRCRMYARYSDGTLAPESALFLAGGSPDEMGLSKFYRARGLFPAEWEGYGANPGNLHFGGGLNLRGYSGMEVLNTDDGAVVGNFVGYSGASGSYELEFDRLAKIKLGKISKYLGLTPYLFTDLGVLALGKNEDLGNFRWDAGVGSALTISFGRARIQPLVLRFDVPLYVRVPTGADFDATAYRYVFGIGRAF